jgi:glutaconate CoA-transferase subunit B
MIETKKYATDYCTAEIMAAFMAKNLKGFRTAGIGTNSLVPLAAIRLAQATHTPDLWLRNGPTGTFNSKVDKLAIYVGDYRFGVGSESRFKLDFVMDMFGDPKLSRNHLSFRGGFQIDKYGNINMAFIGSDPKRPKYRGPGTIGLMSCGLGYGIHDIFNYHHTPRLLVEKVDFVSGPGYLTGPGAREKAGCPPGGGPRFMITPICIFDFDEKTKIMRIKSVHPGHTVDEVLKRTGFKPIVPSNVPETEPPTVEEVAFMRKLDTDGLLRKCTEE